MGINSATKYAHLLLLLMSEGSSPAAYHRTVNLITVPLEVYGRRYGGVGIYLRIISPTHHTKTHSVRRCVGTKAKVHRTHERISSVLHTQVCIARTHAHPACITHPPGHLAYPLDHFGASPRPLGPSEHPLGHPRWTFPSGLPHGILSLEHHPGHLGHWSNLSQDVSRTKLEYWGWTMTSSGNGPCQALGMDHYEYGG